jgi:hypothetical protein
MSKPEDQVRQMSNEAAMVWNHPLVKDFMNNYVKKLFIDWTNAKTPEQRESLWNKAEGAAAFKADMLSHMSAGRAAERKRRGDVSDNLGAII